jgi:nucleotide-binding universal stress UspA family protein
VQPPAEPEGIHIRYAENGADVEAIHRFLLVMAQPAMQCPVDGPKSLTEIIRVARDEAAIMLMRDRTLIGTIGIIRPTWWYGHGAFLTDRWHFILPEIDGTPEAKLLINEAVSIADAAGLKFYHQGKIRPARNGVHLMMPRVYDPAAAVG